VECMGIVEEWSKSILKENTRKHHLRSLRYFAEYLGEDAETLLKLRKEQYGKSKYFETKAVEFFKWLQAEKKLSENSVASTIIGVRSFFSYYDVPLKLKGKIRSTHMKLDETPITIEDIRAMYKFNGLAEKLWISLSLDSPLRIGDALSLKREQIAPEFLLKSEKEGVVGKVFLSERTLELFKRYWEIVPHSEYAFSTPQGKAYDQDSINKMMKRACRKAGLSKQLCKKFHQHLFRKLFISTGLNLGTQTEIVKILSFKGVSQDLLTYFLNRQDLRSYWQKIEDVLSLEPKANGRVDNLQQAIDLVMKTLRKMIENELEREMNKGRRFRISVGIPVDFSGMSDREILELFLKTREKKGDEA